MTEIGFYHQDRGYWQTMSEPTEEQRAAYPEGTIEVPLKPGEDHELVDGEWVHQPPDPAVVLAEKREAAVTSRQDFCIALKRANVLPASEAVAAAKGDWPATFNAALPGLAAGGADADEAQIIWASAAEIHRNHPMIAALAAAAQLSDEQVDALFGIE